MNQPFTGTCEELAPRDAAKVPKNGRALRINADSSLPRRHGFLPSRLFEFCLVTSLLVRRVTRRRLFSELLAGF